MKLKDIKDALYGYSFLIIMAGLMISITFVAVFYPMVIADYEFDRVYDDCMDDIEDATCTNEFRAGWISALKHFKVLWNSGSNATGV